MLCNGRQGASVEGEKDRLCNLFDDVSGSGVTTNVKALSFERR
jgi:hypothetical protein